MVLGLFGGWKAWRDKAVGTNELEKTESWVAIYNNILLTTVRIRNGVEMRISQKGSTNIPCPRLLTSNERSLSRGTTCFVIMIVELRIPELHRYGGGCWTFPWSPDYGIFEVS
jgi:hypothetical protein